MFEWLRNTVDKFFAWIDELLQWAYNLLRDVLDAIFTICTDVLIGIVEQALSVVLGLLQMIDLGGLDGYSSAWGSLPPELINVLGLLGIGEASIIIATAIGIRLFLQLIPFVRLGS